MKFIVLLNDNVEEEKVRLKTVHEQHKYYSTCVIVLVCPNFHIPLAWDLSEGLAY